MNLRLLLLTGFAVLVLLVVLDVAGASGVQSSCSSRVVASAGDTRTFWIGISTAPAGTSCTGGVSLVDVNSGDSIVLECRESTTGIAPPGVASTITVKGFADANSFGTPTGSAVWSWTPTGANCETAQSHTVWCTSDGTSGGTPRYGIIRLLIRAERTSVVTYDAHSDGGTWGIYRCNPRLTAFTDGNPSSSPSTYVGGDTLRTTSTVDSGAYNAATNTRLDLVCGAATNSPGSIELANSAVTQDQVLKGTATTWPDDCTIDQKLVITKKSTITDLTSVDYMKWDTSSPIGGVSYGGQTATRTAKALDRTVTLSSCALSVGAESPITLAMPGETVTVACTARNARSENVATSTLATGYVRRSTQAFADTTDFPSTDYAVGASGSASWSSTARTSPEATDTAGTGPLDYVADANVYAASRTSAELTLWGTTGGVLDVGDDFVVTDIKTWRDGVCTGSEATAFVIASDVIGQREGPVLDIRGNVVTRALTFSRTYTETASGKTLAADSEEGVTTGTSACHQKDPAAPGKPTWDFVVTVTDANGNAGTRTEARTFLSPDSAPYKIAVLGSETPRAPGQTFTMQARTLKRDATTTILEPFAPDAAVYYRINYLDATGAWQTVVPTTTATAMGPSSHAYWINWTVPADWPLSRPALLIVNANLSGLGISEPYPLLIEAAVGGDPVTIAAHDVEQGATANVSFSLAWDNRTARIGACGNLSVSVQGPSGAWVVSAQSPTTTQTPWGDIGYCHLTFTASDVGEYDVFTRLFTDLAETRNGPAATLRAFAPLASQANTTEILENIQDTNNTSSGALSYATWRLWNLGEFRPTSARVNDSSTTNETTRLRADQALAFDGVYKTVLAEGEETRGSTLESKAVLLWEAVRPQSKNTAFLLIPLVGLVAYGTRRPATKGKAAALLAGLLLVVVYLVVNAAAATTSGAGGTP